MLYSKNNEIFNFDEYMSFDKGNCSEIWILNDTLLKLYYCTCPARKRLKKDMFECLKKIDAPNLVKLYDYFYKNNSRLMQLLCIDAYTMGLVKGEQKSFIDCERKFLIYALKELEKTLKILAYKKIILWDVHPRNMITTENGITIIDPDLFWHYSFYSKDTVYRMNKIELINCLNSTLKREFFERKGRPLEGFIKCNDNTSLIRDVLQCLKGNSFYESILESLYNDSPLTSFDENPKHRFLY